METKQCSKCLETFSIDAFAFKNKLTGIRGSYCRGCHAGYKKRHYDANKKKYQTMSKVVKKNLYGWWRTIKSQYKCMLCGEDHPACIHFHHIDPTKKTNNLSAMISKYSKERILEELKKCIPLCANCHAKEHYKE